VKKVKDFDEQRKNYGLVKWSGVNAFVSPWIDEANFCYIIIVSVVCLPPRLDGK
jgi:hypothetical protein